MPKAGIILRWVTFLAFGFWCTLPPMTHQIIAGVLGELDISNQPYGNLGLGLEGYSCWSTCLRSFKVFTFKRGSKHQELSGSGNACFEIKHIILD